MKKLLLLVLMISTLGATAQDLKKIFKFATFYSVVNGGTSLSDVDIYSVTNGLETNTIKTPFDYSITGGVRKIARMGYEPKEVFKKGIETSFSDAATIGKVSGFEFLFEVDYKRQQGENYVDQQHFLRYIADNYILKGEYLEDGFADIKYFETSQRYRYKIENFGDKINNIPDALKKGRLSVNIGAVQRLSEPYGYDPLEEWMLSNSNIHYTYLALQEGYNVDVYNSIYTDPSGNVVANSKEVWESVIIPTMLSDYTEKKRNELDRKMLQSLVIGFDFYHYKKDFWLHSWANIMPWHYDDGGTYTYHNYNDDKQWLDYSGGVIFGYKYNKHLGTFVEGKYNKYWNREWYDFKLGINYVIF